MAFEGLTAQITAEAADYNATIDRAKDRAEELGDEANRVSLQMQVMQGRMDEAADEARDLSFSSLLAARSLDGMTASSGRANVSLLGLSASLTGSVIPGILVAIGAFAALTAAIAATATALLSLVGTFGLLIGAGVVTHLEELKQAFQDVIPRIERALQPLGRVFGPVLEDAIRALPMLTRRIVQAIGGVQQFERALRDFGALLMETIPPFVGAMADFARIVLPALRRVVAFLAGRGGRIFEVLRQTFQRIGDELGQLLGAIVSLLPTLIVFGGHLIEIFGPVLTGAINALNLIISGINAFLNAIRPLLPLLKMLAPLIVAGLAVALGGPLTAAIGIVVGAFTILQEIWNSLGEDLQKGITGVLTDLVNVLAEIGRLAIIAAQALSALASASGLAGPLQQLSTTSQIASVMSGGQSPGMARSQRRRNEARRGNPAARGSDGLPPIEVRGDTGVIEDVGFRAGREGGRRAVNEVNRGRRRQRRRSDRR